MKRLFDWFANNLHVIWGSIMFLIITCGLLGVLLLVVKWAITMGGRLI